MPVPSAISDLSTTPASNSPAGSESPSSTDDYLRTLAAFIKQLASETHIWCGTATGTANALVLTPSSAITAYTAGKTFHFQAASNNSGATTVAVSGLAPIDVEASGIACAGGEIIAGKWYEIMLSSATKAQLSSVGSISANLTTAFNEKRSTVALTATTSPIWTAGVGKIIDGTGTPTITDFPAAPQAGSQREIYPAAGTVLTNGGNISVQGAATITSAAGDKWVITAVTTSTFDVSVVKKDGTPIASISVPVRQTVLFGPVDANGFAAFGGSTGSTTVTASGKLIATAANGFNINGEVNRIGEITNPAWTGLNTNGTMYLYLDIAANGTCTPVSASLAPTYRSGGGDVATNGKFTFNTQEMVGKVGNGSVANQAYRVCVGEVTVAGGVVTAIRWYALMGRYDSGFFAVSAGTSYVKDHLLGFAPMNTARHGATDAAGTNMGDPLFYTTEGGSSTGGFWIGNITPTAVGIRTDTPVRIKDVTGTGVLAATHIKVSLFRGW